MATTCCDLTTASGACFDEGRRYRYALWRRWDPARQALLFIMLNPSTADEADDDPTIRRCLGFARAWGFGALLVGNVFAFRSSRRADLASSADPVGPANESHLRRLATAASTVVVAWGTGVATVRASEPWPAPGLESDSLCLGTTKAGYPCHPLYVPGATCPVPFRLGPAGKALNSIELRAILLP